MGRAEDTAICLQPGLVDHPLTQRYLEENPQQQRHQEAAGKFGGYDLPAQKDEEDEAELEAQVGRRELEDDRVDETGSSAEESPGHRNRRIRAGRARSAQAACEKETLQVGSAQRAGHGPLRNDCLDHCREQEAKGEWPEDLPEHEEGELQRVQDRADYKHFDLAPHQALDRVIELAHFLASAARPDRLRYAVLGVVGQELERHAFECRPGRVDLSQDVDAVAILRHHLLDAAYLPLDAPQPRLDLLLIFGIACHLSIIPPGGIVVL